MANALAARLDPLIQSALVPLTTRWNHSPLVIRELLVGDYGLFTMTPLMLVWATPTVVLFAGLRSLYMTSGLAERLAVTVHPMLRPLGLSSNDLVRVWMGFGCNVPAILQGHRERTTATATIAFGSACSYQMGAVLGVFNALRMPYLTVGYLALLLISAALYARWFSRGERQRARATTHLLHTPLRAPDWRSGARETHQSIQQILVNTLPIFIGMTLLAALLKATGVLEIIAHGIQPLSRLFNLPPEAALPIVLASIRKDGLLLLAQPSMMNPLSPWQALTAVYLGSVLTPCLATAVAMTRLHSARVAVSMLLRQALAAIVFALIIAWTGWFLSANT
jgi:Fe2+ transport system protein B